MKSYTDLEQSKKLAEILPLESADMYYRLCDITKVWHPYLLIGYDDLQAREELFNLKQYKPCWSLAALLDVLPEIDDTSLILEKVKAKDGYEGYYHHIEYKDIVLIPYSKNPIDACYEMILKLKKELI